MDIREEHMHVRDCKKNTGDPLDLCIWLSISIKFEHKINVILMKL